MNVDKLKSDVCGFDEEAEEEQQRILPLPTVTHGSRLSRYIMPRLNGKTGHIIDSLIALLRKKMALLFQHCNTSAHFPVSQMFLVLICMEFVHQSIFLSAQMTFCP